MKSFFVFFVFLAFGCILVEVVVPNLGVSLSMAMGFMVGTVANKVAGKFDTPKE